MPVCVSVREREGRRESELSPYTIWDLEIELR